MILVRHHNAATAVSATSTDADTVLAARGRSFYWARHLLNPQHAARATRLYRFCRHIDDLADDAISAELAADALDVLSDAIAHRHAISPLVADALDLMQECEIDVSIMLELIRGVRSDVGVVQYADERSLLHYCYQVAGTVGIMMCHVLDVKDSAALHHAIDLGIGMQLTNICRDVAEDAALGRRYLPASLVGVRDPMALLQPAPSLRPMVTCAIETVLAKADAYYNSGERGLHYLPAGARAGILVAARLYRAIGKRLLQRRCDYWTRRTIVPTTHKIGLTVQALLELRIARADLSSDASHFSAHRRHDALLHVPLAGLPHTVFGGESDHGH